MVITNTNPVSSGGGSVPDPSPKVLNNNNYNPFYLDSTDSEDSLSLEPSSSYSPRRLHHRDRRTSSTLEGQYQRLTEKIQNRIESREHFFSLEFFPPRTKSGAVNLLARLIVCYGKFHCCHCYVSFHSLQVGAYA